MKQNIIGQATMTRVIAIEDYKHQTIKKGELPSLIQGTQPSLRESCASLYLDRKANTNHVRHLIMNENYGSNAYIILFYFHIATPFI